MSLFNKIVGLMFIFALCFFVAKPSNAQAENVTIKSGPWELKADWQMPTTSKMRGIVLLLHKAAGSRSAYGKMAELLSHRGYASLRVDLRGHGESTNIKAFDPNISRYENPSDPEVTANFKLIKQGFLDVIEVVKWLRLNKNLDKASFAIIGASYTGEEMVKASDTVGFADAYIALAPGNFSPTSVSKVDPSGKPWLFVRAEEEMSFFDKIFDSIKKGSRADVWILPGKGHATDLFEHNSDLEIKLINWLDKKLSIKNS